MPPTPKPEGSRERRNLGQKHHRKISRGEVPVPEMPQVTGLRGLQREIAQAYWDELWTDLGAIFTAADRFPIARLCKLHALAAAGRLGAQARSELRQLEAAFGGSPLGRARLMVTVVDPAAAVVDDGSGVVVNLDAQRARRDRMTEAAE